MKKNINSLTLSFLLLFPLFLLGTEANALTCKTTADCRSGFECVNSACVSNPTLNNSNSGSSSSSGTIEFTNPLGYDSVEGFLANVLTVGRRIIVMLAIVFMVVGALMYVLAGADPDMAKKGKAAISGALTGVALAVAAPSFLKEIGTVLGWNGLDSGPVSEALSLTEISMRVLQFLMSILGVVSLIMMMLAAILYLSSGGDTKRVETGKNMFKYAILGVLIAMSSLVIVKQLAKFFV